MASESQRNAVWFDLALEDTALDESLIDTLYSRAEVDYGAGTASTEAWVRVLIIRRLMAEAAKRTDYKQNQSQEWSSQIFSQLERLEKRYLGDLEVAISGSMPAARWASLNPVIPRLFEFPDTYRPTPSNGTDVSRIGGDR